MLVPRRSRLLCVVLRSTGSIPAGAVPLACPRGFGDAVLDLARLAVVQLRLGLQNKLRTDVVPCRIAGRHGGLFNLLEAAIKALNSDVQRHVWRRLDAIDFSVDVRGAELLSTSNAHAHGEIWKGVQCEVKELKMQRWLCGLLGARAR